MSPATQPLVASEIHAFFRPNMPLTYGERAMVNLLRFAGRNGPWVVIIGVILGFGIPLLSNMARPYFARAIFLFTFGSFLKLDLFAFREQLQQSSSSALMILWATFGFHSSSLPSSYCSVRGPI
jgi:hypothetical protein